MLTFRDHLLADRSPPNTPNPLVHRDFQPDPSSLLLSVANTVPEIQLPTPSIAENDDKSWLLKYIDVAHVRPIVEAMDEDGSGFISVKEANKFALSRPAGWR